MKLLDHVRDVMRRKHYSIRTEHAYLNWIKQYILFHKKCHPKDMGSSRNAKRIFSWPYI
ncbi:MAG: phage integrase N-terminal SAM-like domain-containing protein [Deltaproteobacteria bacterium]|nr:phage integrase N-terminal SAM-like domain-containing protein [Deltaproteobacteria bacterium]